MKQHSKCLSVFCCIATILILSVFCNIDAKADMGGSDFSIYLDHDETTCEGCQGIRFWQKVLTGTTHTFTLRGVPDELKDYGPEWSIQGTNTAADIVESTDTYVKVRFNEEAPTTGLSTYIHVSFDTSAIYPDKSAYDDFLVEVRDEFYAFSDAERLFLNIGSTKELLCKTTLYNAAHPYGSEVILDQVTWSVHTSSLNPNEDGLSINASALSASAPGSYRVTAEDSTGADVCTYLVMVPCGKLSVGQPVTVKPKSDAIYTFSPTATGVYTLQDNSGVAEVYDNSGNLLEGEITDADMARAYKLTAGKEYYIWIYDYRYDVEEDITFSISGSSGTENPQPKTFTVNFDKNGGTKLSTVSQKVTCGKTYGTLPAIGRKGYTFKGWYTAKTGGQKVTSATKVDLTKDQTLYAQWTKVKAPGKLKKGSTLKNIKGRKMAVSFKKVSGANGYEIIYSTSAKFKNSKKTTTASLKKTIKSLKKGKTYYVKVCAYKTDSLGYKVYGKYSPAKKIKIKK